MISNGATPANHIKASNIQLYKGMNPTPKKKSKMQSYSRFNNSAQNTARSRKRTHQSYDRKSNTRNATPKMSKKKIADFTSTSRMGGFNVNSLLQEIGTNTS